MLCRQNGSEFTVIERGLFCDPQQFRQSSKVNGYPQHPIKGQDLGYVGCGFGLASVDIGKGLAGSVEHLEAFRRFLDLPRWCKTAWRCDGSLPQSSPAS